MKLSIVFSLQQTKFEAVSSGADLEKTLKLLKKIGYQGVELAIRDPNRVEVDKLKKMIDKLSLPVVAIGTGQAFIDEGLSLSDTKKEIREKAMKRILEHINLASELGSRVIIGLIRGKGKEKEVAQKRLKESLKICGNFAKKKNVDLLIEPLNRYETNLINNASEALQLIKELDNDKFKILLDTFHMNIEEKDFSETFKKMRNYLGHIHLADSNRLAPGWGHLDFSTIINYLKKIGYRDFLSTETIPWPNFTKVAYQNYKHIKPLII